MPANLAWDSLYFSGETTKASDRIPFEIEEGQMLYDLENDHWELPSMRPTVESRPR